jgi:ribosomal protein S18 acetylase RimI-like enzyme
MQADRNFQIRPGTSQDIHFLKEMLFEAAFWRPGLERPSLEDGLARPDLVYLLEGWGREGDTAVMAILQESRRVGAAWYRFWGPEQHSYGYISPAIPELAIAVCGSFRGTGIGHLLIEGLLKMAVESGIEKVSLSVEVDNPALKLYQYHGFKPVEKAGNSWTMVAKTKVAKTMAVQTMVAEATATHKGRKDP